MKIAMSAAFSRGLFLTDCPPNPLRGLETTRWLQAAKWDFVDQSDVDAWVGARGGTAADWKVIDLGTAGVG
jgi:hypothetical protein